MPIGIYSNPPSLDEARYRRTKEKLEANGPWPPPGLVHHSCFTEGPTRLAIFEIWESDEVYQQFRENRLVPVLEGLGFDAPPPAVVRIIDLVQS